MSAKSMTFFDNVSNKGVFAGYLDVIQDYQNRVEILGGYISNPLIVEQEIRAIYYEQFI